MSTFRTNVLLRINKNEKNRKKVEICIDILIFKNMQKIN